MEETPAVKRFVIKRSHWLRGNPDESCLYNKIGERMCCLGFYSQACGFSANELVSHNTPSSLCMYSPINRFPEQMLWLLGEERFRSVELAGTWVDRLGNRLTYNNSAEAATLMRVNDDTAASEEEREEEVQLLFAQQGIEVVFED